MDHTLCYISVKEEDECHIPNYRGSHIVWKLIGKPCYYTAGGGLLFFFSDEPMKGVVACFFVHLNLV